MEESWKEVAGYERYFINHACDYFLDGIDCRRHGPVPSPHHPANMLRGAKPNAAKLLRSSTNLSSTDHISGRRLEIVRLKKLKILNS